MIDEAARAVRAPWRADLGVYFAPIRHHSPACATHLVRMLEELRPVAVLIEAPSDFADAVAILDDPATRPPVAIVAFRGDAGASYFPFCAHSPEFVALRHARASGADVRFIDLAMAERDAAKSEEDPAQPDALTEERAFDANAYTRALCARLGTRDQNELWDHLFETRVDGTDWRAFFTDVGAYCALVRATSAQSPFERRENDAREAAMNAAIADARAAVAGPIVVVTGGFHTPALVDALEAPATPAPAARKKRASRAAAPTPIGWYVIRYGFEQLDRLNGYAAGLPLPAYYDRVWNAARGGASGAALWEDVAASSLVAFAAWLREFRPNLALSLPSLSGALQNAVGLARLRGHPGPTRDDLLDACRSTFVKGEHDVAVDPILEALAHALRGSAIGDIPASAASPPLVESVRAAARRVGLRVDDGERRRRELDITRNAKHRELSRFLHATALVNAGFATRTAGPDFAVDMKREILFEEWSYAWSPLVEARLIELASAAETLEAAAAAEIRRILAALDADGGSRSAPAFVPVLTVALQAGLPPQVGGLAAALERAIADDADFASVVRALRDLALLWRARGALEVADPAPLERFVALAFARALFLMPDLARADDARLTSLLEGLATLRTIVDGAADAAANDAFRRALLGLGALELPPAIEGAVTAAAHLCGLVPASVLVARLRGTIGGAYVSAGDRVGYLRGTLAISRELLWNVSDLIDAADEILAGLDEDDFIALLPHVRLAFATLDPRETDRVAERVAERYGTSASAVAGAVTYGIDADTVARNVALARAFERALADDGLGAWLAPPDSAA